jgi:hypothetical protein
MTRCDALFDEVTGVMRLTAPLAGHLLAPRLGGVAPELDDEQRAVLEHAGLLENGEFVPRLQAARLAATVPVQTVRIVRRGGEARGWLAAHALALVADRGDGWVELVCSRPDFFADTVARLLALGPCRTPDAGETPAARGSRWRVEVAAAAGRSAAGEPGSLDVLETDCGLWRVRPGPDGIDELEPIGTDGVWRELTSMPAL